MTTVVLVNTVYVWLVQDKDQISDVDRCPAGVEDHNRGAQVGETLAYRCVFVKYSPEHFFGVPLSHSGTE